MSFLFSVFGIAITAAAAALLLRQYLPQYALLITLGGGLLLFFFVLLQLGDAFSALRRLLSMTGADLGNVGILLKALGVCYLTQLGADCCRDAGETALAGKVELAGKAAILLLSLPLFEELISFVERLIRL